MTKKAQDSNNAQTPSLNIDGVSGSTWFKTEQIETAVNVNGDMTAEELRKQYTNKTGVIPEFPTTSDEPRAFGHGYVEWLESLVIASEQRERETAWEAFMWGEGIDMSSNKLPRTKKELKRIFDRKFNNR